MKQKHLFILIITSIFLVNCSTYQSSKNTFFVPQEWSKPIVLKSSKTKTQNQKLSSTRNKTKYTQKRFYKPTVKKSSSVNRSRTNKKNSFAKKYKQSTIVKTKKSAQKVIDNLEQMEGYASWYGPGFHGKFTANREIYDQNDLTAAHKILPMNTWVRVTNLENGKNIVVRINDRGPYKKNRIIDMSKKGAKLLDFYKQGTAKVALEIVKYPKTYDPIKGLEPYKQVVVQVGVFRTKDRATNFLDHISNRYQKLNVLVDQPNQNHYHVVVGPFKNRYHAKNIAHNLKQDGIDNLVRSYRK